MCEIGKIGLISGLLVQYTLVRDFFFSV
eukprot:COSAG05_NODE_20399_length_279_cov_25.916667_1_plen_27_part_10